MPPFPSRLARGTGNMRLIGNEATVNTTDNPSPYPRPASSQPAMTIGRVVAIVLISAFAGGVAGTLIGIVLATTIPDFYRSPLNGGDASTNPIGMGIGLGFSEGMTLGFLLGVLIVCV